MIVESMMCVCRMYKAPMCTSAHIVSSNIVNMKYECLSHEEEGLLSTEIKIILSLFG